MDRYFYLKSRPSQCCETLRLLTLTEDKQNKQTSFQLGPGQMPLLAFEAQGSHKSQRK